MFNLKSTSPPSPLVASPRSKEAPGGTLTTPSRSTDLPKNVAHHTVAQNTSSPLSWNTRPWLEQCRRVAYLGHPEVQAITTEEVIGGHEVNYNKRLKTLYHLVIQFGVFAGASEFTSV